MTEDEIKQLRIKRGEERIRKYHQTEKYKLVKKRSYEKFRWRYENEPEFRAHVRAVQSAYQKRIKSRKIGRPTKLTDETKKNIRCLYNAGFKVISIANKVKVSYHCAHYYIKKIKNDEHIKKAKVSD